MGKNGINTKDLVKKIEKITRERITSEEVVNLSEFQDAKKKKENIRTILIIEDDEELMRLSLKRMFEMDDFSKLKVLQMVYSYRQV